MTNSDGRPPAPPWETPRSGAGPPVGAGSAGSAPGGYGQYGYGQYGYGEYGYGQYADFSPPSYELPPTVEFPQSAGVPQPVEAPAAPPRPRSARRKKSALPWIVAGLLAVVLAAIVLVLGFVAPGSLLRNVFDSRGVADGVRQVLRDTYRVDGVGSVSCPADQPAELGSRFDCRADIAGASRDVTVTVTDSDGRYEVGHPR